MKWWASALLIVLAFTVLVPALPAPGFAAHSGQAVLSDVDVCHSAVPALSSSGDMPCINVFSAAPVPSQTAIVADQVHQLLTQLLLSTQNGHPPKA